MHSTSHWQLWLLVNLGWVAPLAITVLALVGSVLIWRRKSGTASQPDTEKNNASDSGNDAQGLFRSNARTLIYEQKCRDQSRGSSAY